MYDDNQVIETLLGVFGEIKVGRSLDGSLYWMKINDEIEGQAFMDFFGFPSAISASRYLYAFIIPVWHFPSSHGLMLGLGAGIGATMLLSLFPNISLTVIEVDEKVISLARKHFPLVSFYERQKRLRIQKCDAKYYLQASSEEFSFVLFDVFSGDEKNHLDHSLIQAATKLAPYFMANVITNAPQHFDFSENFLWIKASDNPPGQKNNWMLTNMRYLSPKIGDVDLFCQSNYKKIFVEKANQYFQFILSQIRPSCFYC